jgi:RimJ/RimL family protein N-acetyltransferase
MREIVYSAPERFIAWAEAQIPDCRFRSDAKAIGMTINHDIVAAAIFDTFSTSSCFISIASDGSAKWLNREFLIRVFAFPFLQCGHRRVSSIVSETNAASLRFIRHLGWTEEGRIRQGGPKGEDVILFGLLREECRWVTGIPVDFSL